MGYLFKGLTMAKIHLRYAYRGHMSKERLIPAGEYDDHDPVIMGIAAYLIKNGHAVLINAPEPEIVTTGLQADAITFTNGAESALISAGIDPDDTRSYFADLGIDRVQKPDAEAYIESL